MLLILFSTIWRIRFQAMLYILHYNLNFIPKLNLPDKSKRIRFGYCRSSRSHFNYFSKHSHSFCLAHGVNIMLIFTLSGLLSAYGMLYLPETLNQPLEEDV